MRRGQRPGRHVRRVRTRFGRRRVLVNARVRKRRCGSLPLWFRINFGAFVSGRDEVEALRKLERTLPGERRVGLLKLVRMTGLGVPLEVAGAKVFKEGREVWEFREKRGVPRGFGMGFLERPLEGWSVQRLWEASSVEEREGIEAGLRALNIPFEKSSKAGLIVERKVGVKAPKRAYTRAWKEVGPSFGGRPRIPGDPAGLFGPGEGLSEEERRFLKAEEGAVTAMREGGGLRFSEKERARRERVEFFKKFGGVRRKG